MQRVEYQKRFCLALRIFSMLLEIILAICKEDLIIPVFYRLFIVTGTYFGYLAIIKFA
jgi:hypothetical protein